MPYSRVRGSDVRVERPKLAGPRRLTMVSGVSAYENFLPRALHNGLARIDRLLTFMKRLNYLNNGDSERRICTTKRGMNRRNS